MAQKRENPDAESTSNPPVRFTTTHWSVVLEAGQGSSEQAEAALATLCQQYWYPLYAFLRRLQHPPADAEDLTQGFFAYLIERRLIGRADPQLGRFRTFLLGALQGWLSNQRQRESARKRASPLPTLPPGTRIEHFTESSNPKTIKSKTMQSNEPVISRTGE